MQRWFPVILVLSVLGCASDRQPSYVFSAPLPHPEEWTQVYPADRDRGALKYLLLNDVTDARIAFHSHSSLYRDPASVAGELKVRFAQDGYSPTDVAEPVRGGPASFRIRRDDRGVSGKVVVFKPEGVSRCIVAVGLWPSRFDARAVADMDLVMAHLRAWPED
jgi:hypothetical protein